MISWDFLLMGIPYGSRDDVTIRGTPNHEEGAPVFFEMTVLGEMPRQM